MTAIELSKNIIAYAAMKECPVTNLKLQKTLYYVQGYYLAHYGEPLFEDQIENWAYGPVVPAAYFQYCSNGASAIDPEVITKLFAGLTSAQSSYVCKVIDRCLTFPARELVEKTHSEAPWKNTLRNQTIELGAIKNFFDSNDPLEIQ